MNTIELLNKAGVIPQVDGNKVTLHLMDDDGDTGPVLTETELSTFGLTSNLLLLDEHPEGADRGGYVPFAGNCHYREDLGRWVDNPARNGLNDGYEDWDGDEDTDEDWDEE
jgi:hypothetical protein